MTHAHSLGTSAIRILHVAQGVFLLVPAMSILLLTVGHDEAWLLLTIRDMVEKGTYASGAFLGPLTTGGIYSLSQAAIARLLPNQVWIARTFSYVCWLLLYREVVKYTRSELEDPGARVVARTAFFAVPGGLTLTALAFGFVPALLVSVYALRLWDTTDDAHPFRYVWSGVFLGLAVATRVNFLVLLPALIFWTLLTKRTWRAVLPATLVAALAVLVSAASVWALSAFTPSSQQLLQETVRDTGFRSFAIDYVRLFWNWEVLNDHLFLPVAVAITGFGVYIHLSRDRLNDGWAVLLVGASIMLAAWLVLSPIPHLRYIWPALFVLFIYGGIALGRLYTWGAEHGNSSVTALALVVSATMLATGGGFALKQLAHGNSDLLSFEWSRESEQLRFRRFDHAQHQREFARHLRDKMPADEVIGVLFSSVTMRFLTGLECVGPVEWKAGLVDQERLPEYFVIDPLVGSYLYPDPNSPVFAEFVQNAEVVYRRGDYTLLRVSESETDYEAIFTSLYRGFPAVPPHGAAEG